MYDICVQMIYVLPFVFDVKTVKVFDYLRHDTHRHGQLFWTSFWSILLLWGLYS